MNTVALAFGKDKTAIIKGIVILFMIVFSNDKDWKYSLLHMKV